MTNRDFIFWLIGLVMGVAIVMVIITVGGCRVACKIEQIKEPEVIELRLPAYGDDFYIEPEFEQI